MDRQNVCRDGSVSGRMNFKYLLISYVIFFGVYSLRCAAVKLLGNSQLYHELYFSNDKAGILLYIAALSVLLCLITVPAASFVYRGINGIDAKGIGGFFGVGAWLRSAAAYLPMMIIFAFCYHIMPLFRMLLQRFGFNFRTAELIFMLAEIALYAIPGCVYYSFAACDLSENVSVRAVYRAGLKMAGRRFVRLIPTVVLCAAAYYLALILGSALSGIWGGTAVMRLDLRSIAVGLMLNALVPFVHSLIFYLIMLPGKKAAAADSGGLSNAGEPYSKRH